MILSHIYFFIGFLASYLTNTVTLDILLEKHQVHITQVFAVKIQYL